MKKIFNLLLIFALSVISVCAQVVEVSNTLSIPSAQSIRELSCSNNSNFVVTYFSDSDQEITTHKFLVEDKSSGTKKLFSLSNNSTQLFRITDMTMSGDVCYFCGQAGVPRQPIANDELPPANLMPKGFVGYFDAALLMLDAQEYFIMTIDGTYTLSHIAANYAESSIVAIGIPENQGTDSWGGLHTCVVGLQQESTHNWTYDIEVADQDGEYLRDITHCADGYLLVSEFANNSHTKTYRLAAGSASGNGLIQDLRYQGSHIDAAELLGKIANLLDGTSKN